LLILSCKKESSFIGESGLNENDLMISGAVDTFQLITYSIVEDSAISSNTESALLGSYVDPIFGKVTSEFYTQLKLSGTTPNFGDINTIVIDSFVLGLEYRGYYGKLSPQTFEVYQLSQGLSIDSTYYSFQIRSIQGADLVVPESKIQTPKPSEKIKIGTNTVDAQLRLFLNPSLAMDLIMEATNNPSTFASNETFLNYFKGLNIRVTNPDQTNEEGAILYFNVTAPNSKLTIYYSLAGEKKTFDFLIDGNCADFNHVTIENSSTKPKNLLDNKLLGANEFYAQANYMRGVVEIPGLKNIPKNSVIQYARLELPVTHYTFDPFFPSATISVARKITQSDQRLFDVNVRGTYSDITKSYVIDLKDHIQQIIAGTRENTGIIVSPSRMVNSAERIVFNGSNSIFKKQPKLYLIYTTF
jgi:hypothetical protein